MKTNISINPNYVLNFSDPENLPIILQPRDLDINSTPLSLFGYGSSVWGEALQENIIHILENFSSEKEPNNPIEGQLWYDKGTRQLNLRVRNEWYNIQFKRKVIAGVNPPLDYQAGDTWLNTNDNHLYYLDTNNQWLKLIDEQILDDYVNKYQPIIHNDFDANNKRLINVDNPIEDRDAINKEYADNKFINKMGDVMIGQLKLNNSPIEELDAVNKDYVDRIIDKIMENNLNFDYYHVFLNSDTTMIDLPFNYNVGDDKLMVFIQGVKQIKGISYTEYSQNQVLLSESIKNMNVEVIYVSTKKLKYDYIVMEMKKGSKILTLPFPYQRGKHCLFVYVQGVKQIVDIAYNEIDNYSIEFSTDFNVDVYVEVFNFRINQTDIPDIINHNLIVNGELHVRDPVKNSEAANKKYVDYYNFLLEQELQNRIKSSGGTMNGFLNLNYYPLDDKHATNKNYVDNRAKWEGSAKFVSTSLPDDNIGEDGDFWFVYKDI